MFGLIVRFVAWLFWALVGIVVVFYAHEFFSRVKERMELKRKIKNSVWIKAHKRGNVFVCGYWRKKK